MVWSLAIERESERFKNDTQSDCLVDSRVKMTNPIDSLYQFYKQILNHNETIFYKKTS